MASPVSFRSAPAFFRQGPSPLMRLLVFAVLAVTLMVADRQWAIAKPVRSAIATVLYPIQWALVQPVRAFSDISQRFERVQQAQQRAQILAAENLRLREQSQRAAFLQAENQRLRELLELRQQLSTQSQVVQVMYRVADPYVDRVVIDHGSHHGVALGALVLDAHGVFGQVTQVQAFNAEVTLISDPRQHTPVMNLRSQTAGILVGSGWASMPLEMQRVATDADLQEGDTLVTSGLDGLFPPGLPVARITQIIRANDQSIELVFAKALAYLGTSRDLMVLQPRDALIPDASSTLSPAPPAPESPKTPQQP